MNKSQASRSISFPAAFMLLGSLLACGAALVILWQRAREESRSSVCVSHLFGIGFPLRAYHAVHGVYPPLSDEPATTAPGVSWRVLILMPTGPDLDGYRLKEPWNSSHNEQFLAAPCGKLFSCPANLDAENDGKTAYLAVVGEGTVWSEVRSGRIRKPDKETPGKIILIEIPDSRIYWTEPRDITRT